eukprot:Hpha_TRINITY_DN13868_c0_g1::TRINITY_DN13868_c0_g1_i1::g.69794::m.69794
MSRRSKGSGKVDLKSKETDDMMVKQKDDLWENVQHFLESIPELNKRYSNQMESVKSKNPKRQKGADKPGTPLVKRRRTGDDCSPQASPSKPRVPPSGPAELPRLPDNKELLDELDKLKHESYELTTILNAVIDWISLSIPQIKDEDNLGVEVQERVLSEITGLLKVLNSSYESELGYLSGRAEHESQYYKHFKAPSWQQVIEAHDMGEWDDLERAWRDMVRVTINAYSVLSKNMEKLKNPRKLGHAHALCM